MSYTFYIYINMCHQVKTPQRLGNNVICSGNSCMITYIPNNLFLTCESLNSAPFCPWAFSIINVSSTGLSYAIHGNYVSTLHNYPQNRLTHPRPLEPRASPWYNFIVDTPLLGLCGPLRLALFLLEKGHWTPHLTTFVEHHPKLWYYLLER